MTFPEVPLPTRFPADTEQLAVLELPEHEVGARALQSLARLMYTGGGGMYKIIETSAGDAQVAWNESAKESALTFPYKIPGVGEVRPVRQHGFIRPNPAHVPEPIQYDLCQFQWREGGPDSHLVLLNRPDATGWGAARPLARVSIFALAQLMTAPSTSTVREARSWMS